jgi:hypothetical protein
MADLAAVLKKLTSIEAKLDLLLHKDEYKPGNLAGELATVAVAESVHDESTEPFFSFRVTEEFANFKLLQEHPDIKVLAVNKQKGTFKRLRAGDDYQFENKGDSSAGVIFERGPTMFYLTATSVKLGEHECHAFNDAVPKLNYDPPSRGVPRNIRNWASLDE